MPLHLRTLRIGIAAVSSISRARPRITKKRYSSEQNYWRNAYSSSRNVNGFLYLSSASIAIIGLVYAAVPFYRMFCEQTGFAGTPKSQSSALDGERLKPVPGARPVRVTFVADTNCNLPWKFAPEQRFIDVVPGQTALAFYKAKNLSKREITGMATYNVIPAKAAQYFNKIQCFCFEEQRLSPEEEVDMPVFFYLDPEYAFDPMMDTVEEITLAYTFFESKNND